MVQAVIPQMGHTPDGKKIFLKRGVVFGEDGKGTWVLRAPGCPIYTLLLVACTIPPEGGGGGAKNMYLPYLKTLLSEQKNSCPDRRSAGVCDMLAQTLA